MLNVGDKLTTALGLRMGIAEGNLLMRETIQYYGIFWSMILWMTLAGFGIEQLAHGKKNGWMLGFIIIYSITTIMNLVVILW